MAGVGVGGDVEQSPCGFTQSNERPDMELFIY